MTCRQCPGFWWARGGAYVQLEPTLNAAGDPDLMLFVASSDRSSGR
jgi:hypothetical protein